jgi:nucleoid-associated protein EbfC
LAGDGAEMSGFDLDALMKQAQEMQAKVQQLQEEAAGEMVSATAGGGLVKVTATAGGEIKQIEIDPNAIDPSDPELLGDLVTAAVNEALRNGPALLSSKLGEAMPPGLGGLLPGL